MHGGSDMAHGVRQALDDVGAVCPARLRPGVYATLLNLADALSGGLGQEKRTSIRGAVGRQLAKVWDDGVLLPLALQRNDLHLEVREAMPRWDGLSPVTTARDALASVRCLLPDGLPVTAHVDAGIAFLDASAVIAAAADMVSVTHRDNERRKATWQRYVDFDAPRDRMQAALVRAFGTGLLPALRARRASSPSLMKALPPDRYGAEARRLGRGAADLVAAVAARFPGARFDALEASVGEGGLVLVPVFGDGELDVRVPMSSTGDGGDPRPMGGLVRAAGRPWSYAGADRLPQRVSEEAPASTREIIAFWRGLAAGPAMQDYAFCVLGTRHVLAAPRLGGSPGRTTSTTTRPAARLPAIVEAAVAAGIDVSLGLGSSVGLGEAMAVAEWRVDDAQHVARLVRPA